MDFRPAAEGGGHPDAVGASLGFGSGIRPAP
jgi:hypothetical protein